jgi:hypothetical protein
LDKTEELLFPFNFKYWFKLAFVYLLSGNVGGNGGGLNYNFSGSRIGGENITGKVISENLKSAGIIGLVVAFIAFLAVILGIITSIFKFIFLEALYKKKYSIREGWNNNGYKGISYFIFTFIFTIIVIAGLGLVFLPVIISIINIGFEAYFSRGLIEVLLGLLPYIILAVIWFIIVSIFKMFVKDFVLVDMYVNKSNVTLSLKRVFRAISYQKTESFVYLVSRIVLVLASSLISLFVIFVILFVVFVPGLIFYLIFSKVLFVFIVLVVVLLMVAFFAILILLLPLNVFLRYFNIICYESLIGKSKVKKK